MSEQETLSRMTDLGNDYGSGRVNRVTLGLLLKEHLRANVTTARTSAYHRMERATDGLSSAVQVLEQAGLMSVQHSVACATFRMWHTQLDTVQGYLQGSGADPRYALSYQRRIAEIRATSEGRQLIDAVESMTKVGRSRAITHWVLGDGRFRADTDLDTLWLAIWSAENTLRGGYRLTSQTGSEIGALQRQSLRSMKDGATPIGDRIRLTKAD